MKLLKLAHFPVLFLPKIASFTAPLVPAFKWQKRISYTDFRSFSLYSTVESTCEEVSSVSEWPLSNSELSNEVLYQSLGSSNDGAAVDGGDRSVTFSEGASMYQGRRININDNLSFDVDEVINTVLFGAILLCVGYSIVTMDTQISRGWTMEESVLHVPSGVWSHYNDVLKNNPIAVKAATSATVYTIGDILAQRTEVTSIGDFDRMRVVRSMLAGLIGHGPLSHFWYLFCDSFFDNILHWTAWWAFIPKVVLDQTFWGPIWNNTYILLLGIMKRDSLETMWSDIRRTTVPLILSGLKLWPLAHCITYGVIPVENRLLWVDMVEILWVTILASTAASASNANEEKTNTAIDSVEILALSKD